MEDKRLFVQLKLEAMMCVTNQNERGVHKALGKAIMANQLGAITPEQYSELYEILMYQGLLRWCESRRCEIIDAADEIEKVIKENHPNYKSKGD